MGMFDSIYDGDGREWQTKALDCTLKRYAPGDAIPGPLFDYQMKVISGWLEGGKGLDYGYALIHNGNLMDVLHEPDEFLQTLDYPGGWLPEGGD